MVGVGLEPKCGFDVANLAPSTVTIQTQPNWRFLKYPQLRQKFRLRANLKHI